LTRRVEDVRTERGREKELGWEQGKIKFKNTAVKSPTDIGKSVIIQGLLEVLRTRQPTEELELPAEIERLWALWNTCGDECAGSSSTLLISPRSGERNSEPGIEPRAGDPNVKLLGIGGSVGRAGTLGGVRGEGEAVPDAIELRRDILKPGVVGDG
jgi:hypothetical protein